MINNYIDVKGGKAKDYDSIFCIASCFICILMCICIILIINKKHYMIYYENNIYSQLFVNLTRG